jgi:hypothetical protein
MVGVSGNWWDDRVKKEKSYLVLKWMLTFKHVF